MTKTGKEAYRAYQNKKKEIKQAIKDHRNLSCRTYLDRDFSFVDNINLFKPPETRITYILSHFYFNN